MKKSLIAIIALGAVCGYAKTPEELVKEYTDYTAAGVKSYAAALQTVAANADIAETFDAWAKTDEAKTVDASDKINSLRLIFGVYLGGNKEALAKAPELVGLLCAPDVYLEVAQKKNSNYYDDLKAKNYVVDGVPLPQYVKICLAVDAGDADYIRELPVAVGCDGSSRHAYVEAVVKDVLAQDDVAAAKAKCNELENKLVELGDKEHLEKVQLAGRVLTTRLFDKTISGR